MSLFPARFGDTLTNLLTGLGSLGKDKAQGATFTFAAMTQAEIDAGYRGDWMMRKIVDKRALDSVREWRLWQAQRNEITLIEAEERRLQVQAKAFRALTWSRLYGGAGLILGTGDGDMSTPLDTSAIGKGGLKYLLVAHRYQLTPVGRELDPSLSTFGGPASFSYSIGGAAPLPIHASRVVVFHGAHVPDPFGAGGGTSVNRNAGSIVAPGSDQGWWGDSVLQAVQDAVRDAASSNQGIAALVQEAALDVVKVKGLLSQSRTQEYRDQTLARWDLAMTAKSISRTLLLDSTEEYEKKQVNFSQLPEVSRNFLEIVAGAADYPLTVFLGTSGKGLNATGEGDERAYNNSVAADQRVKLGPAMSPLDDALIRSALGSRPDAITSTWAPLWSLNLKERADAAFALAQATSLYVAAGIFDLPTFARPVANMLIENETYPGLDAAVEAGLLNVTALGADETDTTDPSVDPTDPGQEVATVGAAGQGGASTTARVTPARDRRVVIADAAPRSAYVWRDVRNGGELRRWAEGAGIPGLTPVDELRVVVALSRTPFDWLQAGSFGTGPLTVEEGGPRVIEVIGGHVVMSFTSWDLKYRAQSIVEDLGGSSEFPGDYAPRIILGTLPEGIVFAAAGLTAYGGALSLGPEQWAELLATVPPVAA